jgi:HPt (histidine-containing phosphotransfer) domain-containing protein
MSELVLDTAVLDDLVEHIGVDGVRAIIGIFLGECRELAVAMSASVNPVEARRAAHSLKSSAGQLGATALAEAALAVEIAADSNSPELRSCIAALTDCASAAEQALAARLAG